MALNFCFEAQRKNACRCRDLGRFLVGEGGKHAGGWHLRRAYPGWDLRASTAGVLATDFVRRGHCRGPPPSRPPATPVAPPACVAHAPTFSLLCSPPSLWSLAGARGEQAHAVPWKAPQPVACPSPFPREHRCFQLGREFPPVLSSGAWGCGEG